MSDTFTTVSAVKTLLGITVRTADGQLELLVNGVNQAFKSYLNRDIFSAAYTETRDGTGTNRLMLKNYPVNSVSLVQVGPPNLTRRTLTVNVDYVFDAFSVQLVSGVFCRGVANTYVAYAAGFPTAPDDLREKATKVAATRYKELDRLGQISKAQGGEVVTFDLSAFPKDVMLVLDQYKARIPVGGF